MANENKLVDLSYVKELMTIQQNAYRDATSLLFNSLHKRIEDQNNVIYELRKCLEFSQQDITEMKKELTECKNQLSQNSIKLVETQELSNSLQFKQAQMEDHTRKKNIRIEGINETKQENWEQTQVKVQQLLDDKLELENVKVDFAHRINRKQNRSGPRPIIARLTHDSDKEKTMKNSWKLKGSQIFINEDLSEFTLQKRKELMTEMKNAKQAGKIAYFRKEKLIIKDRKQTLPRTPEPANSLSTSNRNVANLVQHFTPSQQMPHQETSTTNDAASLEGDLDSPRRIKDSPIAKRTRNKPN